MPLNTRHPPASRVMLPLSNVAVLRKRPAVRLPVRRKPGVTVRVTGSLVTPFAEAVICVVPGSKPIARPLVALIDATLEGVVAQVKVRPVMRLPWPSFNGGMNESVALTAIDD